MLSLSAAFLRSAFLIPFYALRNGSFPFRGIV